MQRSPALPEHAPLNKQPLPTKQMLQMYLYPQDMSLIKRTKKEKKLLLLGSPSGCVID